MKILVVGRRLGSTVTYCILSVLIWWGTTSITLEEALETLELMASNTVNMHFDRQNRKSWSVGG